MSNNNLLTLKTTDGYWEGVGEPIGTIDGKNVYSVRRGKNTYKYETRDGNKVDGRKVKKFSKNTTNRGATSVEAEKMKKKAKATPKPVIKNEVIKNVIIEKKEEPPVKQAKKTTAKQGKQTEEQLAKRRAKYQENKAKELARKKAYREANKDKIDKYQEQYRASAKGKAYQKAYREENKKIPEPKRTKAEVEAGVKAFGLPKGKERYAVDINKKIKENKPRKVRTDKGKERGKYDRATKEENLKKYPRPVRKSGESEEVYNVRRGLWEKVVGGRLPPSMLTMKNAVKVAYGDGITIGGKDMTTSEWMRKIEKETGRDIERDGLGVGNLKKADIDPDAVY